MDRVLGDAYQQLQKCILGLTLPFLAADHGSTIFFKTLKNGIKEIGQVGTKTTCQY